MHFNFAKYRSSCVVFAFFFFLPNLFPKHLPIVLPRTTPAIPAIQPTPNVRHPTPQQAAIPVTVPTFLLSETSLAFCYILRKNIFLNCYTII